jgi:hypothetical protein
MFVPVRRRTAILALGALLVVSASAPCAARPAPTPRGAENVAVLPVGLLDRLWASLQALWGAAGCTIDPNGRCANGTPGGSAVASPVPNGCSIDPSGVRCASAAASPAPAGCTIDPDGCIAR